MTMLRSWPLLLFNALLAGCGGGGMQGAYSSGELLMVSRLPGT
jgi:hypothetical protein